MKPPNGSLSKWIKRHAILRFDYCVRWPFSVHDATGYPGITLWHGKQMFGHRAMCIAAHGNPPTDKHQAAHSCNNRWCINPNHLRWATPKENQNDRIKHGTVNSCARHGMAKLGPIEVAAILTTKAKPKVMADWFGVTDRTIRDVRNNVSWKEMRL